MPLRPSEPTILAVFTLRLIEYGAARGLDHVMGFAVLTAHDGQEIADQLPSGELSLARVAKRLGMSERSLGSPRLSLGEIAFLLGFSDVSAFSRAFKGWSGLAPGQYRSQGRGAAGDVAG